MLSLEHYILANQVMSLPEESIQGTVIAGETWSLSCRFYITCQLVRSLQPRKGRKRTAVY